MAPARGLEEAAVSDLRVGLCPQLIFYWDRNVVPADLITNPVGLSLAWGGKWVLGGGESDGPKHTAEALY